MYSGVLSSSSPSEGSMAKAFLAAETSFKCFTTDEPDSILRREEKGLGLGSLGFGSSNAL